MNLVIDVGNTLIKSAVFQGDNLIKKKIALKQDFLKNIDEVLQAHPKITHVLISSVVKSTTKWEQRLREKLHVINLHQDLPQLFTNRYSTPATMGQDRIALVSAAAKLYPEENILVIDA
ncbi:type III pantothenate kinase [Antarcticibacterium sp. 1MA-6-2]|uniref:type III pantothenate kinase n=1 Tax=Antarcticibacterium sp. 1MA-6-2 TaxID=2908210 RepID=UPI002882D9DC|nr:type III pantothenate kinase [Antarcticibacterium sp. 1MA-6-2]